MEINRKDGKIFKTMERASDWTVMVRTTCR